MTAHDHAAYVAGCFRCDLSHYEYMRDNDPDPMLRRVSIPPADLARALYRAERAEREREHLLRVISLLEGHRDADLARLRHLPPEEGSCQD